MRTTNTTTRIQDNNTVDISSTISSPPVLILIVMMLIMLVLSKWRGRNQLGILARGRLAGAREKKEAQKKGLQRIHQRKHNEVCLWIINPKKLKFSPKSLRIAEDKNTLFMPNCESGLLAMGDNGSGKSFSFLQPLLMSGLMQGFPAVFFDIKYSSHKPEEPAPCAQIGGLGIKLGYDVQIFAPGLSESCRINPIELIRHPEDVEMAMQFAKVLYRNVIGEIGKGNQFFTNGAIAIIAGFSLVAKLTPYPDLLTVRELSNLEVDDFKKLLDSPLIPENIKITFDILKQASDDAYGDLKATVSSVLAQVLMPAVTPAISGKSTIDFDLDNRQLLIFGVDGERRDVVCPIIATIIHLLTNRNLLKSRQNPYLLWLDELPALYLPEADQWPNQFRSAGLVMAVGTQSREMLEAKYGKEGTSRILKGLNTQAIFQLASPTDCEEYSKAVGEEDILYESRGKSYAKRSKTSSNNQQRSKRRIIEPDAIGQLPQGKGIIFSRGNKNDSRVRVPLLEQIKIPEADLQLIKECQENWDQFVTQTRDDSPLAPIDNTAFQNRREAISCFLRTEEELAKVSEAVDSILSIEERLGVDEFKQIKRSVSHV